MGSNFDKDPLAVEQNNYLSKIVNIYIVFDLDNLDFEFKNCLYGATSIVKKRKDKESMCIVAMEWDLIVQVHGVLIMILLEMF